jgi:hypothetical protein
LPVSLSSSSVLQPRCASRGRCESWLTHLMVSSLCKRLWWTGITQSRVFPFRKTLGKPVGGQHRPGCVSNVDPLGSIPQQAHVLGLVSSPAQHVPIGLPTRGVNPLPCVPTDVTASTTAIVAAAHGPPTSGTISSPGRMMHVS